MTQADGAELALAGYMYQFLGTLGLAASARDVRDEGPDSHLTELLRFHLDPEFWAEYANQDTALRHLGIVGRPEYLLVQFKYKRGRRLSLGISELREIVDGLVKSRQRLRRVGAEAIGYALVCNRNLSADAKKLVGASFHQPGDGFLDDKKRGEKRRQVLQNLLHVNADHSDWVGAVRHEANRYGCLPPEFPQMLHQLVGNLIAKTAARGTYEVTVADFAEVFAGSRIAFPIEPTSRVADVSAQMAEQYANNAWIPEETVQEREQLRRLLAATRERGLVIVTGNGGCGKSVLLYQWAASLLSPDHGATSAFTLVEAASDLPSHTLPYWVSERLCAWMGLDPSPRQNEPSATALNRVRVAASTPLARQDAQDTRPVLHLALDGVDESVHYPEKEERLKELVRLFWDIDQRRGENGLPATLVVSCRSPDDIREWTHQRAPGIASRRSSLSEIAVDQFDDDELREVSLRFDEHIGLEVDNAIGAYGRELAALRAASGRSAGHLATARDRTAAFGLARRSVVRLDVLVSLFHPAMWSAFTQVRQSLRPPALQGRSEGVELMARAFLERFLHRCAQRQAKELGSPERSYTALHHVAAATQGQAFETRWKMEDWISVTASHQLDPDRVETLFDEAASGGLIERNRHYEWTWRHELVRQYLVRHDCLLVLDDLDA